MMYIEFCVYVYGYRCVWDMDVVWIDEYGCMDMGMVYA